MRPRCEASAAILQPVEPVNDIPLDELLRCMEENLPASNDRVHPDQIDRILKLVAKAVRSTGLIEPSAGPDPLGKRLVLEPIESAVERWIGRLNPDHVHKTP